jgi:hypothetical protein
MRALVVALLIFSSHLFAGDYRSAIDELNFTKLSDTYSDEQVSSILEGHEVNLSTEEKSATEVLITPGALNAEALANEKLAPMKIKPYVAVGSGNHHSLTGLIGDASLDQHIAGAFDHPILHKDSVFLEVLGEALVDGVLTGYDLSRRGI